MPVPGPDRACADPPRRSCFRPPGPGAVAVMLLTDFGKLHVSSADYAVLRPDSVDAAVQGWRTALAQGAALRVRGGGHGLSGATLPRTGETLVRTRGLDHYRVEASGLLTVGSGAILWDIRDFVADHGWRMPVYNGGWAGPSLGGFVNAGGMGLRLPRSEGAKPATPGAAGNTGALDAISVSERHGGFWVHVARIRLIDGRGNVHDILHDDADFPWIFASMGQFGLILELTLRLLPQPGATPGLAVGSAGRIPASNPANPDETDILPPPEGIDWVYWFTALVPVAEEDAAWRVIGDWCGAHRDVLRPTGGWVGPAQDGAPIGYRYVVRRKAPTPPLLYPRDEDFVAMGVMAICSEVGTDPAEAALTQAEQAFVTRITGRGWALYCQAENLTRSLDFPSYWGPDRWARFCELKSRFDPDDRVNAGEVWPGACPAPLSARRMRGVAAKFRRFLGLSGYAPAPPA